MHTTIASTPLTKPLMRGWSHLGAFMAALVYGTLLLEHARAGARGFAATYVASLLTLFGTSALYHCAFWSVAARRVLRPIDHSAIFVLIAGTFTAFAAALDTPHARGLLWAGWTAALLGAARAIFWHSAPKKLVAAQSVLTGWLAAAFVPALAHALPASSLVLIGLGGALYTLGAMIFAFRRPNPWPRVFGFHEIFHLLVIAGAAAQFAAAWRVLT
ncbi:MAG: hemolysin III family protein [Deltaproteobacteria bacterium]|nr:hemolysin III family protein [Deltaproteobacteria bacterium]